MGCVGPARRFDALRALAGRRVSAHCCADGPPCAFRFPSEACRSTPAPSRDPRRDPSRRTMLPSLGFVAPRRMPERRTRRLRGVQPRSVPRPRFGYLHRGVHHRSSGGLAAPERPRASPFEAFSSRPVGLPLGRPCPPAVARVGSPRPYRSVRTRPASGPCSRARARSVRRALAVSTRRCLPGLLPFRAFSPSVLASASWIRARSPTTRWAG